MIGRLVVVLFGPPGAGKTTLALTSGLEILDRDAPQWRDKPDAAFSAAVREIGQDPRARVVVIRSGATSSARSRTITMAGATHAFLVLVSEEECHRRVSLRARGDARRGHGAIGKWWRSFDHLDELPAWPGGWPAAFGTPLQAAARPRGRKAPPAERGYGPKHRAMRRAVAEVVKSGRAWCARCGLPIRPGDPWDLGHSDDRRWYTGAEHVSCNRSAGAREGHRRRVERVAHNDPPPPPGW